MLTALIRGVYAVVWLLTTRWLYGRWRGALRPFTSSSWCDKCFGNARHVGEPETAARAIITGLAWPLALLVVTVVFRPPPTAAERAEAERRLRARVAELERELGIGEPPNA
jgi:hypothetical protein